MERSEPRPPLRTRAQRFLRTLTVKDLFALVFFSAVAAQAIRWLGDGWAMPLLDRHGFRQTQTAISAYSIAHGASWLRYETPVFGAPYSVPFEFPLYQGLVAWLHRASGVSLDQCGRATSVFFFLATLVPAYRLLRSLETPRWASLVGVAFFLVSPLYLYWSRTFLIESTALFFSLATLAYGHDVVARGARWPAFVAITIVAVLATLVKVTTAYGFFVALAILLFWAFVTDPARRANFPRHLLAGVLFLLIPLIAAIAWTRHADALKHQNLLADGFITSDALSDWNFGTWEAKTSRENWARLWHGTMNGAFGGAAFFVGCASVAVVRAKRLVAVIALSLGTVAAYATFTNLHLVHDYYQYATDALPILIVGLGLGAADGKGLRWILVAAFAIFGASEAQRAYLGDYHVSQTERYWTDALQTTNVVRRHVAPNELIVVYGQDWSPIIPYYAERRSLMIYRDFPVSDPRVTRTLARSRRAGNPVGGVVLCERTPVTRRPDVATLLGPAHVCESAGPCTVCY